MANRKILFALLVLCLSVFSVCGRFGGRSSSRGSSHSSRGGSWGKSWGGSSSSSHSSYKPSSSWSTGSSSGSSWSKPSYPSSSSGLSGSSWSKPSYPSSSSGLSGSSWSKPSYPSSSSGLSGSSWSKPSYPSSSSGLSGSGSGSHSYPSSSSGLSGSSSNSYNKPSTSWWSGSGSGSHSYPSSSSGLSGSGSGSKYPSGSGSHSYPSNTGLSGGSRYPSSGSGYKPHYNVNTGRYDTHSYHYIPHTYYTAPQHVYVTQYRNSDSRYGDLLTGLTLYNMGRSHSHYHDHYYYDDYYRHRYNDNYNTGSYNNYNHQNNYYQSQSSYSKPQDEATCSLRINNDGNLDVLKIPCEIVSTFTEGGKKVQSETHHVNTTCTTNITITPNPVPVGASNVTAANRTTDAQLVGRNLTADFDSRLFADVHRILDQYGPSTTTDSPIVTSTSPPIKIDVPIPTKNTTSVTTFTNKTDSTYIQTTTTVTDNQTVVNVTTCSNQTYTDPLSVKGGPLTAFDKMECLVDIRTKDAHFQNPVDCKTLMEYAKMPEPKKENKPLLPPRDKLKSWMEKPPWWLAMFIAV